MKNYFVFYLIILFFIFFLFKNENFVSINNMKFENKENLSYSPNTVAKKIMKIYGKPSLIEKDRESKYVTKLTWHDIEGCDGVIVKGDIKYKWHPLPAVTFVYAYKYFEVPEFLQGPLMYASETIIVDYIDIPTKYSKEYYETGKKLMAKVSGACASITISVITINFVLDMVNSYKNTKKTNSELMKIFRAEYDKRILTFLCGKGIQPAIDWYPNNVEKDMINGPFGENKPGKCKTLL